MTGRRRQLAGWALAAVLACATAAWPQVKVGDNLDLNLSGNAQFGFLGTYDGISSTGLNYGFNGNLTGSYYDPRFLQFRFLPYYNESRFNSNYNSITGTSGFSSGVDLFNGSIHPVNISYNLAHNAEGQFNFPGTIGSYENSGNTQDFSIGAGLFLPGKPTIQGSFGTSNSNYTILGSPGSAEGSSRNFVLSSTYDVAGFHLGGSYVNTHVTSSTPQITAPESLLVQDSNQSTLSFSASRPLTSWSNMSFAYGHSNVNSDYSGYTLDGSFDTVGVLVTARPTRKLTLNANLDYSSNYSAQVLSSLGSGPGLLPITQEFGGSYRAIGGRAAYNFTDTLVADAHVERRTQSYQAAPDASVDLFGGGLRYSRTLGGGQFGAYVGITHFSNNYTPVSLPITPPASMNGYNTALSYTHPMASWQLSGAFNYARSAYTQILGYTQSGYGFNVSASRRLGGWNMSLGGGYNKSGIDGLSTTDSTSNTFNAAFSRNKVSFSGSYSRGTGDAFQLGSGLVPVPGIPPLPTLMVLYNGASYGAGASYTPTRRLQVGGSYSHASYNTANLSGFTQNTFTQVNVQSQYYWRQLSFNGGFGYISQALGIPGSPPGATTTIYFGVSRHFDVF